METARSCKCIKEQELLRIVEFPIPNYDFNYDLILENNGCAPPPLHTHKQLHHNKIMHFPCPKNENHRINEYKFHT